MVKCDNCGIDIPEGMESCPNCGRPAPVESGESENTESEEKQEVKPDESQEFNPEEAQNSSEQNTTRTCRNCGANIYSDDVICPLCGHKIDGEDGNTDNENKTEYNAETGEDSDSTLVKKINLRSIIIPTIIASILAIILSIIGIAMEDFYYAYVIAIIISVGICAAPVDNKINATISGFLVGLILGMLETSIVELVYGSFVAAFYAYYSGNHTLLLVLCGVLVAFFSNIFLRKPATNIVTKMKKMM